MQPLSSRPEARFALIAGLAGALAATAVSVQGILASTGSTAAIGFLFVPFIAIAVAVPAGIWGLAVGCVWHAVRGTRRYLGAVLAAAWVAALAGPAVVGWEVWRGLSLERAVAEARTMSAAQLEEAFERSPWREDRFFLGALSDHRAASATLLDRIARLPDPGLYEAMGSYWDVLGENRKGLAVMRLVASNANAEPATLEHLAARADAFYVLHDVLRNPKTPQKVLERHYDTGEHLLQWGLALNPHTPPAVLEKLSRKKDYFTRVNVTRNPATPREALERLAQDKDEMLRRFAREALERRAKEGAPQVESPR